MSGLCDWRSDAFTFQENEAFCNEVTELALAERPLRMFFQAGQLLCELALLSTEIAMGRKSSLVASSALCLSLACLRCGVWRDGSPGAGQIAAARGC